MWFILLRFVLCIGTGAAQNITEVMESINIPTTTHNLANKAGTEDVACSEVDLVLSRSKESNLGNFLTDAMVHAFKNISKMAILPSKTINLSRLRKGKLKLDLFRNMSGLLFSVVNLTGGQLRSKFEESVAQFDQDGSDDSGELLQVSGVQVEFDLRQDIGRRLTSALVYCDQCSERESLEDKTIYTIVVATKTDKDTNKDSETVIQEFLETFPNKTIPGARYKKKQCRTWLITKYYKDREYLLYFLLVVMSLSGFLTIISNSTVIYVSAKTSKKMFEKSILSLAFVDLLTGIICTPSVCLIYYYKYVGCEDAMKTYLKSITPFIYNYKWILPNFVKACTCYHVLYITTTRFLRLYSVSFKITRIQENIHLFLIYLFSMLFCLITMFVEQNKKWCDRIWPHVEVWMTIILPIIITVILDCFIFSIANRHFRRGDPKSKSRIKNVQAAKTTALMVGALLVCYLPLMIKWHMCGLNSPVFSLVAQTLVAANSFMNPFIYAMKVPAFRSTLMGYVRRVEPEYSDSGISMEERRKTRLVSYSATQTSTRGRKSLTDASQPLAIM